MINLKYRNRLENGAEGILYKPSMEIIGKI